MFSRHVTKDISAYCHGEVSAAEAKYFSEHIMACVKCRSQFEEIKIGIKFAEQLSRFPAPETLWRDLETRLDKCPQGFVVQPRRSVWPLRFAAAAVVIIFVAGLGIWWKAHSPKPINNVAVASWGVERINGTIKIGTAGVEDKGQLAVGEWLETGSDSCAHIDVSSIGQVEVDSNTRVRLVQTQPTEHRLELARGKMSARIWAPPRLFFVDTPSAVAADLGCAYTLEVDDHGASLLRVTSGWVALELKDRESMVPAGAACQTRPGVGPGTPYFEDAAPEFRQSLTKVDFDPDVGVRTLALTEVLNRSRRQDTLTLWHLLPRVEVESRGKIYDKLARLVPPPANVTREGVIQLDETMLNSWRSVMEDLWTQL
ncbi:MAG TPA: FecR domain-containing protein [Pyrinomonadaceae bacterium]